MNEIYLYIVIVLTFTIITSIIVFIDDIKNW